MNRHSLIALISDIKNFFRGFFQKANQVKFSKFMKEDVVEYFLNGQVYENKPLIAETEDEIKAKMLKLQHKLVSKYDSIPNNKFNYNEAEVCFVSLKRKLNLYESIKEERKMQDNAYLIVRYNDMKASILVTIDRLLEIFDF